MPVPSEHVSLTVWGKAAPQIWKHALTLRPQPLTLRHRLLVLLRDGSNSPESHSTLVGSQMPHPQGPGPEPSPVPL